MTDRPCRCCPTITLESNARSVQFDAKSAHDERITASNERHRVKMTVEYDTMSYRMFPKRRKDAVNLETFAK